MIAADYAEFPSPVLPPAMPPRPIRRLSTLRLLRVAQQNALAACDEQLFDELIVERRLLGQRVFVISDPDGIRRVLQDNLDNYPRLVWIRRLFAFTSGSGMLHAEGEVWRRHRRLINPTLGHRALLPDGAMLVEMAEEMARHLASLPLGTPIDVHDAFRHLITLSAGHIFAGLDRSIDTVIDRIAQYPGRYGAIDLLPVPGWLRPLDRWRRTRVEAARLAPVLDRLIAERRDPDYAGSRDLLWRLANVRDRETGEGLARDELHDEILTLGNTAITSLRALPWVWYLLATNPWAERRLHAELDQAVGDGRLGARDLVELTWLRQVIDETMRLYPPQPILMMRRATADDTVCGRPIPRGSVVSIVPWVVHRHRKLWHNPDRFDPDRFAPEAIASRPREAYLPFAVGPHVCVGASMAMLQLMVAVGVLARHFRFRLVPGRPIDPIAWTNLRPKNGIWMTLEPRRAVPSRAV